MTPEFIEQQIDFYLTQSGFKPWSGEDYLSALERMKAIALLSDDEYSFGVRYIKEKYRLQ